MPLTSIQAAEEWRAVNGRRGFTPETSSQTPPAKAKLKTRQRLVDVDRAQLALRCAFMAEETLEGEVLEAMDQLGAALRRVSEVTGMPLLDEGE